MPHVLLLGAGFSRNWGAPLSRDVTGSLLSDLHDDPALESALRQRGRTFEDVMADFFKPASGGDVSRIRLQNSVVALFDRINAGLVARQFNFSNDQANSVKDFLERFDAIFTLNQDLLLEHHYLPNFVSIKWNSVVIPGMQASYEHQQPSYSDVTKLTWRPTEDHTIPPRTQPYFKLHGSSNWKLKNDDTVMIMGTGKAAALPRFSLLSWYQQELRERLQQPNTKLMVIGYSFQDEHINEIIREAYIRSKLATHIVDPRGMDVLEPPGVDEVVIKFKRPIQDIKIVGETRTPLSQILGGNPFERDELFRFFKPPGA